MKYFIYTIALLLSFISCSTKPNNLDTINTPNNLKFEPNEDGEYDIIVFDAQYDIYLKSIAQPKNYHSYEYYKSRNRFYVVLWNQRHMMPSVYNPNLYAVSIELDPSVNYGLDFEYKLFNFFKFIEWKYKVRLT
ncbi:DUF6146 family protein [Faecalibacter rhinopitheci]|uniref:Lipoprotein n=1 Tax=Faecalibacter rhinopitheci TaxID=2779678 RepID=A0A8J7G3K8_9FLAO|nr:DUF6146 family protein [Faecalibacter rhinopitheci]MBF0596087.1 hypothetical protein [Faecalibacter rhinopitheci]MBQ0148139.1 hypothetical protein [Candidatus Onthonaster equi]